MGPLDGFDDVQKVLPVRRLCGSLGLLFFPRFVIITERSRERTGLSRTETPFLNDMSNSDGQDEVLEELEKVEEEMNSIPPDKLEPTGGPDALYDRMHRIAEARDEKIVRLDAEIVSQFEKMAGEDENPQTLINQALQEWLDARSG